MKKPRIPTDPIIEPRPTVDPVVPVDEEVVLLRAAAPAESGNASTSSTSPSKFDIRVLALEYSIALNSDNRSRQVNETIDDAVIIEGFLKAAVDG